MLSVTLKPHPPVVVALHLPYKLIIRIAPLKAFFGLTCLCFSILLSAFSHAEPDEPHYIAQLHAQTPLELTRILTRAERWSEEYEGYIQTPIAVVLHGNEASAFLKQNYQQNRNLVNLAARLDAFNVVDLQICERWMGANEVARDQVPPFIETVKYGPKRIEELIRAGYQSF